MREVNYEHLFHDSNSKVWMVNKVMVGNAVVSPELMFDKHLLIFHRNGHINYLPMRDLTRSVGERGFFILKSSERQLILELDRGGRWMFDLKYLTEDSILMVPMAKSDTNISMQLVPFPEF
jgi:hypothetical protein